MELVSVGLDGLAEDTAAGPGDPRSSRPFVLPAMVDAVIGLRAELNSPKPSDALLALRTLSGGGAAVFAAVDFGGGLGVESKKLPPARGGGAVTCGAAGVARVGGAIPGKEENDGGDLGCGGDCCTLSAGAGAGAEAGAARSPNPSNRDGFGCGGGGCCRTAGGALEVDPKLRPPNASFRSPKAELDPPGGPCMPPNDD